MKRKIINTVFQVYDQAVISTAGEPLCEHSLAGIKADYHFSAAGKAVTSSRAGEVRVSSRSSTIVPQHLSRACPQVVVKKLDTNNFKFHQS